MPKHLGKKGQASIMIGMMMMTFVLFFTFVINTGMLVHAKINLQNAVDLAAYAGAASQARLLNQVSFLNYEMRRQYKKFLFRYYVLGNQAQATFPRNGAGSGPMPWQPRAGTDYNVPSVCVIFRADDNYCQLPVLPRITIPPVTPLDQINNTLRQQLLTIESIRAKNCESIGKTNVQLLLLWLFNTDPTLERFPTAFSGADQDQIRILSLIKGLGQGMGLVPKEFLIRQRINTLKKYVNAKPQTNVTVESAQGLKLSGDPGPVERTVLAFYSAYNTLGADLFEGGTIRMDELMPEGTDGANLLQFSQDPSVKFDTYAVEYQQGAGGASGGRDCQGFLVPFTLPGRLPVGVVKDPSVMTYYAIRLQASARLLFSPIGNITLTAYAAAQPFGSRIGPKANLLQLTRRAQAAAGALAPAPPVEGQVPNIQIRRDEGSERNQGFDRAEVVGNMFQLFRDPVSLSPISFIDSNSLPRVLHASMAPNPFEIGKYNIPIDLAQDPFMKFFDSSEKYAFYAPIMSPDQAGNLQAELENQITNFFPGTIPGQANTNSPGVSADFRRALQVGITDYLTKLGQRAGEDGESLYVARLRNPMLNLPNPSAPGTPTDPIQLPDTIMVNNPKDIKTSWADLNDETLEQAGQGRIGYSVKFVAFETLLSKPQNTTDQDTWANRPDGREGSEADINSPMMKH
jgi:hypothetical protein